jgi:two-component system alkaline phosphatase synthesis response regulator PhoP
MGQALIAIVEDEPAIVRLLEINLQAQGFLTISYGNPMHFLTRPADQAPDLLILDIMMPEMDGLELCRRLRQAPETRELPILMLTARGEEIDRVLGLEIGADDYLTKPFSVRELIARVKALLRRSHPAPSESPLQRLQWGPLSLDPQMRQAFCGKTPLHLSGKEFDLLQALMEHPGWIVTREGLLERIWGFDFEGESRTVDMHIANLRRKLEQSGGQAAWIQTQRGFGYRLTGSAENGKVEDVQ